MLNCEVFTMFKKIEFDEGFEKDAKEHSERHFLPKEALDDAITKGVTPNGQHTQHDKETSPWNNTD